MLANVAEMLRTTIQIATIALPLVAGFPALSSAADFGIKAPLIEDRQSDLSYWCPMHAGVRGRSGERCPICGMALVPMPDPDYRPYWLEFPNGQPAPMPGHTMKLVFRVHQPGTGKINRAFEPLHERLLHLFIVGQDFTYFSHVHPTLRHDGSFVQLVELPKAGIYRLIADFLPTGGAPQLLQKTVATRGYRGSLIPSKVPAVDLQPKIVQGVRIVPTIPPPVATREQLITFHVEDAASGQPITDLEPFLGATGHLLIVSGDFQSVSHSHPVAELSNALGPDVVFQTVFAQPGVYKLWAQFQRHGEVLTASFVVNASRQTEAAGR